MGVRTAIFIGLLAGASSVQADDAKRWNFAEMHMGVPFRISVYGSDKVAANTAVAKAYKRIAELNQIFSDYESDSEVSRLRSHEVGVAVAVSNDLHVLLQRALNISRETSGAFDVTVGPLVRQWRRARRRKRLPEKELLAKALRQSGYERVKLDRGAVTFSVEGMRLDFGAIAKGYACDEALRVLREAGLVRALVDGGGDVVVGDAPPGRPGWRVRIESDEKVKSPGVVLLLKNQAVATSGDRYRFVDIDRVRYSHIVDPRTGKGLTTRLTVTAVAGNATDADAYASAVSVLGLEAGLRFAETKDAVECRIVDHSSTDARVSQSRGFQRLVAEPASSSK